jgi:hypothetical protein
MARYIDADELIRLLEIEALCNGGNFSKRDVIGCVKAINTADVAPKSEVQRLYYNLQAVLEERAETKQEIAREIFEEIEKVFFKYYESVSNNSESKLLEPIRQAQCFLLNEMFGDLDKLKNKYTEDQNNEN